MPSGERELRRWARARPPPSIAWAHSRSPPRLCTGRRPRTATATDGSRALTGGRAAAVEARGPRRGGDGPRGGGEEERAGSGGVCMPPPAATRRPHPRLGRPAALFNHRHWSPPHRLTTPSHTHNNTALTYTQYHHTTTTPLCHHHPTTTTNHALPPQPRRSSCVTWRRRVGGAGCRATYLRWWMVDVRDDMSGRPAEEWR